MLLNNVIDQSRYIIVKIGSALLVNEENGELRTQWLEKLVDDLSTYIKQGKKIIIVSSGAIAIGRNMLSIQHDKRLKLEENQALASVGQITLAHHWQQILSAHDITGAQILLTLDDTEVRKRYLNARATLKTLHKLGCVPIINENDSVSTFEIRYGDNDRLAARVATMVEADLLIILSNVDGLYAENPWQNPEAEFFHQVEEITQEIENMAGLTQSSIGRGGMRTKVEAARIATAQGCKMIIANGLIDNPIRAIQNGRRATLFTTQSEPHSTRKVWIAGTLNPQGKIYIDEGAVKALHKENSLLAAGIIKVEGCFERGDAVEISDEKGIVCAHGLTSYSHIDVDRLKGKKTLDMEKILGYRGRKAIVHKDDLVLKVTN